MRTFLLTGAAIALAGSMAHAQNDPGSLRNPAHHQNAAPTTASVDGCDCVTERPEVLFPVNCRRVTDTRCSADRF